MVCIDLTFVTIKIPRIWVTKHLQLPCETIYFWLYHTCKLIIKTVTYECTNLYKKNCRPHPSICFLPFNRPQLFFIVKWLQLASWWISSYLFVFVERLLLPEVRKICHFVLYTAFKWYRSPSLVHINLTLNLNRNVIKTFSWFFRVTSW